MDRLQELKQEAIDNPGKKKRGCASCKKKKEINEPLPQLEVMFIPSIEDIKKAYDYLSNVKDNEKKFINDVFISLFNEEFDFTCRSCANKQSRKLYNHITKTLNTKI